MTLFVSVSWARSLELFSRFLSFFFFGGVRGREKSSILLCLFIVVIIIGIYLFIFKCKKRGCELGWLGK